MKTKIKLKTILIVLMIILVPLTSTSTQAWTRYTFSPSQTPSRGNVRVGDTIIIKIERIPADGDDLEEVLHHSWGSYTELEWSRNGIEQTPISCDQVLPTIINPITFTLGPFNKDDFIEYRIFLCLDNARDYKSSQITFVVYPVEITTTEDPTDLVMPGWIVYALIGVGVLVILLGLAYLRRKKKMN